MLSEKTKAQLKWNAKVMNILTRMERERASTIIPLPEVVAKIHKEEKYAQGSTE